MFTKCDSFSLGFSVVLCFPHTHTLSNHNSPPASPTCLSFCQPPCFRPGHCPRASCAPRSHSPREALAESQRLLQQMTRGAFPQIHTPSLKSPNQWSANGLMIVRKDSRGRGGGVVGVRVLLIASTQPVTCLNIHHNYDKITQLNANTRGDGCGKCPTCAVQQQRRVRLRVFVSEWETNRRGRYVQLWKPPLPSLHLSCANISEVMRPLAIHLPSDVWMVVGAFQRHNKPSHGPDSFTLLLFSNLGVCSSKPWV